MDLPIHPADHRQRLAEIRLRMSGAVAQRHKHLALPLALTWHVILHDRHAAAVAVLVAQTLENPLRRGPLLHRPTLILLQDTVDEPHERIQFRTHRRMAVPVTGRNRKRQHLRYCPRVYPKTPRSLPAADPLNPHRVTDPTIKLHELHPPAPRDQRKELH
jgi:hypothetical protein